MPGNIIYRGPSMLDGKPIVVLAIAASTNRKTGGMLQTCILRDSPNTPPLEASKTGEDFSICGNCPHRGTPTDNPDKKQAEQRSCYVTLGQGPTQVWKAYKAGKYEMADPQDVGAGVDVRVGTYGDPAAVPAEVWERLLRLASGWTGYTHQWRMAASLKDFCMASADTAAEMLEAQAQGWRTFRITHGDTPITREIMCPSDKGVKCEDCQLCGGTLVPAKSIAIRVHGSGAKWF